MDYIVEVLYDGLGNCDTILEVDDIIPIYGEDKINITITDAVDAHTGKNVSAESAFDDILEYIEMILSDDVCYIEEDLDYEVGDDNGNVITIYGTINIL